MQTAKPQISHSPKRTFLVGCLFVLLAAFGFSAKSILVKLAYAEAPHIDAISLLLLRMVISLPFFLAVAFWSARNAGKEHQQITLMDGLLLTALGFIGYYLSSLLDFKGLSYISAGLERVILYLYPTFVILLTSVAYHTAITRHQAIALFLSYAGVMLVYTEQDLQANPPDLMIGSGLVASSAITFAVFMVASGVMIKRMGALRFTAYSMTIACLITSIHFLLGHSPIFLHYSRKIYCLATLMALFSTVLPSFFMNAGIQRIGAGSAAIISSAGPIGTLILAFFILEEQLSIVQVIGTLLVLAGVYTVSQHKT